MKEAIQPCKVSDIPGVLRWWENLDASDCCLFVHVMGGQTIDFFRQIDSEGFGETIFQRSALSGVWKVFSIFPSREGVIRISNQDATNAVVRLGELNAGVSMLGFYAVSNGFADSFLKAFVGGESNTILAAKLSIASVLCDFE